MTLPELNPEPAKVVSAQAEALATPTVDTSERDESELPIERRFEIGAGVMGKYFELFEDLRATRGDLFDEVITAEENAKEIDEERANFLKDAQEDPILKEVYDRFSALTEQEMGLYKSLLLHQPLTIEQSEAFAGILSNLDILSVDESFVFHSIMMKVFLKGYSTLEMAGLFNVIPVDSRSGVIAKLKLLGIAGKDDVETYLRQFVKDDYSEGLTRTDIQEQGKTLERELLSLKPKVKFVGGDPREYESDMDQEYRLTNKPLKVFGALVSGTSVLVHMAGAVRLLLVNRDIAGTIDFIKSRPVGIAAAFATYGLAKSIRDHEQPFLESMGMSKVNQRTRELVLSGIPKSTINIFNDENTYMAINSRLIGLNMDNINEMRNQPVQAAFPQVAQYLGNSMPVSLENQIKLTNQVIDLYMQLRVWGISAPSAVRKFATKVLKEYDDQSEMIAEEKKNREEEKSQNTDNPTA